MRSEVRSMLRLAAPVIVAEMGWVTMGIVDTVMVGPLGPAAIGAVGTGSTMFFAFMVLGMGTLLALDTFVSQAYGAGRIGDCHRWLFAGVQLALALTAVLTIVGVAAVALLPRAGMHPDVVVLLQPYLLNVLWSTGPLLLFTVFRRYLQAMNVVRPITVALVTANLVNVVANWVLISGRWGFPAFGVVGSAYATLAARIYLAGMLFAVIWMRERRRPSGLHDVPFALEWPRIRSLVRLGLPAAMQITLEVGVFAAAGALATRITPLALAANQIVLNIVSFFFMVPYGLSSAAAVRVGHAVGRQDPAGVRRAGTAALGIALVFAFVMSALYAFVPGPLLRIFTADPALLGVGAVLLLICAAFQPFDGFQVVATGALRGLGDTGTPMVVNLVSHWLIGLPLGYFLCFRRGWGVAGLWSGLAFSLILVGATLLAVWYRKTSGVVLRRP